MSNRYEVRPFTTELIEDVARLRAADHARHRRVMPALDPAYEAPDAVEPELADVVGRDGATGLCRLAPKLAGSDLNLG